MSDLQRDIEQVEWVMSEHTDDEPWAAWQRIRARLTPDRERVAMAIHDVNTTGLRGEDVWLARADAAIDAAREAKP